MLRYLLLSFGLVSFVFSYAQRIQVLETETANSIPFVKIYPFNGQPFLADIDGFFTLPADCQSFTLRMNEYVDTTFAYNFQQQVFMRALGKSIDEVTIQPGINPAERIMELAIQNRKKNHPMSDLSFQYTSYSKLVITINPDALAAIPDTTTDSSLISMRAFFNKQYLFLMESTTEKSFEPPFREKEEITAYKVSGFTNPLFSTFASELQTFNFYENQFSIFGKTYINPLAFGGVRRYLFILEDQTINGIGDTTFTIRFRPRLGKNFDGLKGVLYINSQGYALEKVIVEPALEDKSQPVAPKVVQEYAFINQKKWFPVKLSTEVVFKSIVFEEDLKDAYAIGKGTTYIDQIKLGADLKDVHFNAATVVTKDDAGEKDSVHWQQTRKYELSEKEQNTYKIIDSLGKAENFEKVLSIFSTLAEGKLQTGYIQFDLARLLNFNGYEGFRLGLGIETSNKFSKRFLVGSYVGYGFKDKQLKYGGYGTIKINKTHFVNAHIRFQDDVFERGGTSFYSLEKKLESSTYYRNLYIQNMERQRLAEIGFSAYLTPNLKIYSGINYQRIYLLDNYSIQLAPSLSNLASPFEVAETVVECIWKIGDKVKYIGEKRISTGSKWPTIRAKAAFSIPSIYQSTLHYQRYAMDIYQTIPIRGTGNFTYLVSLGHLVGEVPLYLSFVAPGTGGEWNLSVANTFETVKPSSFYNTSIASNFMRFSFKKIKTGVKWTSPQVNLHHAIGFGTFDQKSEHNFNFQSFSKGYFEGGVLINNLLNISTTGLGIGCFYNYGAYSSANALANFMFKFGLTSNF
jgi:hypothetical protein